MKTLKNRTISIFAVAMLAMLCLAANVHAWWDDSWSRRVKIEFDNSSAQSVLLEKFPVLIKLTSSRVDYRFIQPDGDDIRFIDSDDFSELYYEVEEWNHGGTSHIWVRVPDIPQGDNSDYIYLYYGNSTADVTSYKNAAEVWNDGNDGFRMVQHLNETSGNPHEDSTSNNNDSTAIDVYQQGSATGKIDGADDLESGNADVGVTIGDDDSLHITDAITIEAWVKPEDFGTPTDKSRIVNKNNCYILSIRSTDNLYGYIFVDGETLEMSSESAAMPTGVYQYVVMTWEGGGDNPVKLYRYAASGAPNSEVSYSSQASTVGPIQSTTDPVYLGSHGTGEYFDGLIDEVRISAKARSAGWIEAQYKSMTDNFASYGALEFLGVTATTERWGENSNCDHTGVTEDTYTDEGQLTYNMGNANLLRVGDNDGSRPVRTMIKFNLSELQNLISHSSQIVSANLKLQTTSEDPVPPSTIVDAFRIKKPWNGGTSDYGSDAKADEVTWRYQYYDHTDWIGWGCDDSTDRSTTADDEQTISDTLTWYSWDVTDSVKYMFENHENNEYYGWVLISRDENGSQTIKWRPRSSEFSNDSNRPYLEITYNTGPADFNQVHYRWRNDDGGETGGLDTGTSNDGSILLSADFNLNTQALAGGRSHPDGVAYRVKSISGNDITLGNAGGSTLGNTNGIEAGDEILIINLQGSSGDNGSVGNYEFLDVQSVSGGVITVVEAPTEDYDGSGDSFTTQKVFVQRVPNYIDVETNTYSITAGDWDEGTDHDDSNCTDNQYTGIVVFRASGTVTVNNSGTINVNGKGYRGGPQNTDAGNNTWRYKGEGFIGGYSTTGSDGSPNSEGGGPGHSDGDNDDGTGIGGGGGAGYGTPGSDGTITRGTGWEGLGGSTYGVIDLTNLRLGSGGGSGGHDTDVAGRNGGAGGYGGGIIYIIAHTISVSGAISSNGADGDPSTDGGCGGGGGSGGSILLQANSVTFGSNQVTATGGQGEPGLRSCNGGDGGNGRIRVEADTKPDPTTSEPDFSPAGTPSGGGGAGATFITQNEDEAPTVKRTAKVRLRMEVANDGGDTSNSIQYRLEYATDTGGPWTPVPVSAASGEHWQMSLSDYIDDGGSPTSNITPGLSDPDNYTFVQGQLRDDSTTTSSIELLSAQFTEIEYSIETTTDAKDYQTYYFRLTRSDGSTDNFTYTVYPQITLEPLLAKVGTFVADSGTVPFNQSVTDVGFQPKAVLFWITDQTSADTGPYGRFGRGWTDGTNMGAVATAWDDSSGSSNSRVRVMGTKCITLIDHTATDGTEVLAEAEIVSLDDTNNGSFTIKWTKLEDPQGRLVTYLALGGDALTNVKVGSFSYPQQDNYSVTDLGFKPNVVLFMGAQGISTGSTLNTTDTRGGHGFGIGISSTDTHSDAHRWRNQTTGSSSGLDDRYCLVFADDDPAITELAIEFVSMDSNGFSVTRDDSLGNNDDQPPVIYLAMEGIDVGRGVISQGTTSGSTAFKPSAVLFDGGDKVATNGFEADAEMVAGVATSNTDQAAFWIGCDSDSTPYPSDTDLSTSAVIRSLTSLTSGDPQLNAQAVFESMDSGGFTISWSPDDTQLRKIGWIALGPAVAITTTTLGDGTDPSPSTVAPGSADLYLDQFTFVTSSGSDSVDTLTVTTANTDAIASMEIWNEALSTQYFSTVSSPSGDTWSFTGGTAIPVTDSPASFRVRFTAKNHATLPNPIEYTVTGTVTAYTCTNAQAGTDTDSATITVDNDPPDDATWGTITPGDQQVELNWTNPVSDFNKVLILQRAGSAVGDTPAEGTEYSAPGTLGSSTIVYVGSLETFTDTGLTNGTNYYYKIFAYDACINYATGVSSGPHTPYATTTLGDGTDPGNSTVAPGSADQYLDQFTFVTNSGSDSVTALTVTTANTDAIASIEIWNDALSTQYFSTVSSPSGDTWNFSGPTAIPVTDSPASFRVRFTAKDHATLPNPIEYAVTGTVTAFTCTNAQAGTDTDSATITVDNDPPDDATWGTITPGDQQVELNWTNPVSDFNKVLILQRAGSAVGDTPAEGTEYSAPGTLGSSTIVYVGSLETFTDTGLTNGTDYYYKIFAYDTCINYATGVSSGPHTPDATTTLGDGTDPGNSTVAPGSADQYLDQFTFVTSSGSDSVTALTVTTANTDAIASIEIWNEALSTQYFSTVSSPSGDTWSFSTGTAIPVTDSPASFRVRFTAKDHATLPNPIEYPVTGTVTAYTCTNSQAGTDTDSATITVDNDPPDDATWGTITPGDQQVELNWTNPVSDFNKVLILQRAGSAVGDTPAEGTEYSAPGTLGSSTIVYVGSLETFTDTGLTNGTDYYYKIFAYDTYINYATGAGTGPHTPEIGYLEQIRYRWRNDDGGESGGFTGTGDDGDLAPSGTFNVNEDTLQGGRSHADGIAVKVTANPTTTSITVDSIDGFADGDEVLLINLQGYIGDTADVGNYEFLRVSGTPTGNTITVSETPTKSYDGNTWSNQKIVLQRVPNYQAVTLDGSDSIMATAWDGLSTTNNGSGRYATGIIAFRATGTVSVGTGTNINVNGMGYTGGNGVDIDDTDGYQGESYTGAGQQDPTKNWGGGGGGDITDGGDTCGEGGGGGGYGSAGTRGDNGSSCPDQPNPPLNEPGDPYGVADLTKIYLGSGGGGGGCDGHSSGFSGYGGNGGGIIIIYADTITIDGALEANGSDGLDAEDPNDNGNGGGGSGGSIFLAANSVTLAANTTEAIGGTGPSGGTWNGAGGNGGDGRIRIEADTKPDPSVTDPYFSPAGTPSTGSGATFMAAQNTPISDLGKSTTVRLRLEVSNEGTEDSDPIQYRLEYAESTSGPWITVPGSATNQHWQMSDSGYFTDGYPTADIDDQDSYPALTNENAEFVPGELKDTSATTTGSIGLSTTQFTEIEYSIEATNNADDGQTYYFRLVDPSSTYAINYIVYPEVTLIEPIVWVSTTSSTITVETPQIKMVFDEAQGAGLDYLYGKTENNSSTGRGGDKANYNVWSTKIDDGTERFENGAGTLTLLESSPARVKIRQQYDYTTDIHLDRMWTIYPSNKIAIDDTLSFTFGSSQSIQGQTGFYTNSDTFFSAGISNDADKIWVVTDNANPDTSTTYSDMLGIPYTQPFFGRDASPLWDANNESGTPNTYYAYVMDNSAVLTPPGSDTKYYLIYPYLSGLTTAGTKWPSYANDYRNPSTLDSFNAGSRGWFDSSEKTVSWWDTSWSRRRKITFDKSPPSQDLQFFPVLIRLHDDGADPNINYGDTKEQGEDIRFVASDDTTVLPHEIEEWKNASTNYSYIWVKVPEIKSSGDTYIYMYYGNSNAEDEQSIPEVWNGDPDNPDDDFKMVQHLEENTGSAEGILDSTSNGNHGTPYSDGIEANLYTDSGHINGADALDPTDGTDDYIDVQNNNSSLNVGQVFTFTCWAKRGRTGWEEVLHSKYLAGKYSWKVGYNSSNVLQMYIMDSGGGYQSVTADTVADTAWHHIAARSDGSELRLFFDGNKHTNAPTKTITIGYDSSNLKIGVTQWNSSNVDWFKGSIDEVRISNTDRSDAWIAAEFQSESDNFVNYEGEKTFSSTADFFNEAEGCYAIDMADDQKLVFNIHGTGNTRHSPAFKIRNYRSLNDPQAVYVDGVLMDNGRHYTMSVIPFSEAWYSGGASPNPAWWDSGYSYRRQLTIGAASSGYSIKLALSGSDASDIYNNCDDQTNGDDFRVVWWNGSGWTELDRYLESFSSSDITVYFKIQEAGGWGGGPSNYYLYYGNSSPGSPMADGTQVFLFYDDGFENGLSPPWDSTYADTGDSITQSSTRAYAGTYSAKCETDNQAGATAYVQEDIAGQSTLYIRMHIYLDSGFDAWPPDATDEYVNFLRTVNMDSGWQNLMSLNIYSNDDNGEQDYMKLYFWNSLYGEAYFSTNKITTGQWHSVEVKLVMSDGNAGEAKMWLDGNLEIDQTGINTGTLNITRICSGIAWQGNNTDPHIIYIDEHFFRPAVDPEPTTSIGGEETEVTNTQLAAGGLTTSSSEYLTRSDNNYTLNFGTDEYLYLGSTSKFRGINVDLVSEVTGSGLDLAWKYWNGTGWADLEATPGFTDNTSNLTKDGTIYWTSDPTDWSKCSVNNGTELYYVRTSLATGSYDTAPQENLIKTDILLFQYMLDITGTTISLIGPTAVDLVDFKATGDGDAIRVEWETAQEINNMGFNLYRSTTKEGSYQKLNSSLIPGLMYSATGKRYTYHDRTVTKGQLYYYKLEDIDTSGKHTWHGPVCVDWDGDGIPDDWELAHGLDPTVDDGDLDYDNDGLTNYEEYLRGTDPFNPDTDGDGILDGDEIGGLPTTPGGAEAGDGVTVVSQDETGMVLELKTSRFDATDIVEDGTTYQRLTIPTYTHGLTDTVGSPELPLKGYWVDLPQGMGLELEVEQVKTENSSGYLVYPVPEKIAEDEQVLEQFSINPQAYAVDDFTPTERVTKGTVAYLRDQKKAQVLFSPISFNPQAGDLRLHTLIRVRVTYVLDQRSEMQPFGFGGACFGLAAADPNWPPAGNQLFKITTTTEGIYRISHDELAAAGMDTASIDPKNLQLYNRGAEVAMYVSGEEDGYFNSGDYLEFYGEKVTTKYTNTNVYWLVADQNPGLRMAEIDGTPGAAPLAGDFLEVVHAEQDYPRGYWGLAPGEDSVDRWFWVDLWTFEKFVLPNSPQDFPIELPGVSTAGGTATVTAALRGFTTDKLHQMSLSINGTQIAQESWEGQDEYRVEVDIDQGLLISGVNTVTIELVGTELDGLVLDWIEVAYLRTLDAVDDLLRFTSDPPSLFVISDFTVDQDQLSVFDITNPLNVGRIQGFVVTSDGANFTLSFQAQGETADHTYIALGESQIRGALEIAPVAPPTLIDTQNGADYILITHRDIGWELDGTPAGWLHDLTEYRQSQGLRVMAVDIDEIYDGFNYGISDPQAVKDFISYAYHNWQPPAPQYVVLVGDTTFDPKGNFAPPGPGVPTYLGWTRYMGETAIDDWFVQIVGPDALGDLSLGRLPAADKNEASLMVRKIIDYEEAPKDESWQKRLLLVADDREPIFEQINEAIAGLIPADYTLIKGYLEDYKISPKIPQDLTDQMIAEINQGVLIVNYAGHGSTKFWADERIFSTTHIPGLSNDQRLPVMVLMTCLNGYFVMPTSRSLAEEMLLADGAGAVAAFAPTGMTDAQVQKLLDQGLTEAVFQTGIVRLGEAVHAAKETLLVNTTGQEDTANSFSLMGDPAMTLPVESPSDTPAPIVWGGGGGSGGGCFIASAAYGSFLDDHVGALRAFRDQWLIGNPIGNHVVKAYYATSPPAAQWIRVHENIRALTRIALVPIVAIAQLEVNRTLVICLALLLLISPLAWLHCLTKGRKRALSEQ